MGLFNFIRSIFTGEPKKIPKKRKVKEKTYGLLKFQYKGYYKISATTQKRAIGDHNKYLHNFIKKHKRNPNRRELGRIVRGSSHETIHCPRGKKGQWLRQWLRQYLYGLYNISYTKR